MKNFCLKAVGTENRRMHLYLGKAKSDGKRGAVADQRFFLRAIIRHSDLVSNRASFEYMRDEGERVLLEAMDALEVAGAHLGDADRAKCDCNHIFLNFLPCVTLDPQRVVETVRDIVLRYGARLWKLRVLQAELKYTIRLQPSTPPIHMLLTVSNDSGYFLNLHLYKEVLDRDAGLVKYEGWEMYGLDGGRSTGLGPLHGLPVSAPYQTKDHMQHKRYLVQKMGTTYAYDFPEMFRQAQMRLWRDWLEVRGRAVEAPSDEEMGTATEIWIDESGDLVERDRPPGENNCGMVAWRLRLRSPEFPDGRELILIANDMTVMIGSFGVREDNLFKAASELARREGLPRLYIAANSGARIGLAEEVKSCFRIAWVDPGMPEKGFHYLYLSPEDWNRVNANPNLPSVRAELIEEDGEKRYRITDILGREDSLGVENLRGSGMIAGETSDAYKEVVTMSLVSCRAVGIGAYLVRLGQRTVQVDSSHIILTGAPALNKLLGKEVYSSNNQLGGVQIMYNNGVSHAVSRSDFDGVAVMLRWLSYMPAMRGGPLPVTQIVDSVERAVEAAPTKNPYDPRVVLGGRCSEGLWELGLFDRGSWDEVMEGWAKSVVTGRARLGGIPVAVIAVETRTTEVDIPADPATPGSEAKTLHQAGQVWFPDSAFKTAQAIEDFNREQLPLFVFANWRGFSGGMKDMFDQVLKFGSYIVDGLRAYKQPVFVYIPPHGELRGGAWVVVDPSINPEHMEMFADPDARGGVLEPEGIVEIKYREKDLVKTMSRCDPTYHQILVAIESTREPDEKKALIEKLEKRKELLKPLYHTVAVQFADLHDTAGRMKHKGVISEIVPWREARLRFYWRLRRRLLEEAVKKELQGCQSPELALRRWWSERGESGGSYESEPDERAVSWLSGDGAGLVLAEWVGERVLKLRRAAKVASVRRELSSEPGLLVDAIVELRAQLSSTEADQLQRRLAELDAISHSPLSRTTTLP